jgi:hypothetical protein
MPISPNPSFTMTLLLPPAISSLLYAGFAVSILVETIIILIWRVFVSCREKKLNTLLAISVALAGFASGTVYTVLKVRQTSQSIQDKECLFKWQRLLLFSVAMLSSCFEAGGNILVSPAT